MAARDDEPSVVLSSDMHIYDLAEQIDAPEKYVPLAMDLLGSKPEVSNLIGKTQIDYEDVVFRCLLEWRNEHGSDDGKCRELIEILRECKQTAAADKLEQNMQQERRCLSQDKLFYDLASEMNCAKCYRRLAMKLRLTEARLSNLIGTVSPQYKDAMFKAVIQWKNQHGSSFQSAQDLRRILKKHRLSVAVEFLDDLDPGLMDTSEDEVSEVFEASETSPPMEDVRQGQYLEPEAGVYRSSPEGRSFEPSQNS
ncbi:uncharacterized protein [Diadema setosum]|uniref:uncharacterized protein n=1 Tax=Diadema setosum TaxID=31175 RepID=UPI003B3A72A4